MGNFEDTFSQLIPHLLDAHLKNSYIDIAIYIYIYIYIYININIGIASYIFFFLKTRK